MRCMKYMKVTRGWMQYSLRALLMFVLLASIASFWIRDKIEQAHREERALSELAELGRLTVGYSYQETADGRYDLSKRPNGNAFLRSLLGDAFFDDPTLISVSPRAFRHDSAHWFRDLPSLRVIKVSATFLDAGETDPGAVAIVGELDEVTHFDCRHPLDDEDIIALGNLSKLKVLEIGAGDYSRSEMNLLTERLDCLQELVVVGGAFGPGAAREIGRLPALKRLDLRLCRFADEDFATLVNGQIEELNLYGTNITDEALFHIGQIQTLKRLTLSSTSITDAGIEHLESLHGLRELTLDFTQVSDKGLRNLARLQRLRLLELNYCRSVSSKGVAELARLPELEDLDLSGTSVDDSNLDVLLDFRRLVKVSLYNTGVTDEGILLLKGSTLKSLELPDSITDESVPSFLQMKCLENLDLPASVSVNAVKVLQKSHPACRIRVGR